MKQTIQFKSIQDNYRKEYLGLKRNTIRKYNEGDNRFEILEDFRIGKINNLTIMIINPTTNEYFERNITDVTEYLGWWIISW